MKPKKRQPLDFSAVPVETPAEDAVATSEVSTFEDAADEDLVAPVDPPTSESDLDLEIMAPEPSSPRARAASRRGRTSEPVVEPAQAASPYTRSLATSAAQPPAPVADEAGDQMPSPVEPKATEPDVRRPAETFALPPQDERGPMPAVLFWTLAVAAAALWALAPIAFALGYARGVPALKVEGFALAVFVGQIGRAHV